MLITPERNIVPFSAPSTNTNSFPMPDDADTFLKSKKDRNKAAEKKDAAKIQENAAANKNIFKAPIRERVDTTQIKRPCLSRNGLKPVYFFLGLHRESFPHPPPTPPPEMETSQNDGHSSDSKLGLHASVFEELTNKRTNVTTGCEFLEFDVIIPH
jgi:hypothetical protein